MSGVGMEVLSFKDQVHNITRPSLDDCGYQPVAPSRLSSGQQFSLSTGLGQRCSGVGKALNALPPWMLRNGMRGADRAYLKPYPVFQYQLLRTGHTFSQAPNKNNLPSAFHGRASSFIEAGGDSRRVHAAARHLLGDVRHLASGLERLGVRDPGLQIGVIVLEGVGADVLAAADMGQIWRYTSACERTANHVTHGAWACEEDLLPHQSFRRRGLDAGFALAG